MVFAAIVVVAVAVAARCLPSNSDATWALRIFSAGIVVTVIPGMLAVLAWRPRDAFSLLELIGVSLGISFALIQLVTIAAVMYAFSVDVAIMLLATLALIHAAVALWRGGSGVSVRAPHGEIVLGITVMALGAGLYLAGSPFDTTEPRIHISLVRRLVHLSSPTLYTMYIAPDIVYTYPFPGTHYMLALMARLDDIDPFFLYYKTRAIWGMAAPVLLYGCARTMFASRRIALAATFVAAALAASGAFGGVPGFSWAQLAPYSHASDLAMGVLLPALLLLAVQFLSAAESTRAQLFRSRHAWARGDADHGSSAGDRAVPRVHDRIRGCHVDDARQSARFEARSVPGGRDGGRASRVYGVATKRSSAR